MRFTKMEGLGNDYIYLNCMEGTPPNLPDLAIRLSDRHFGVGGDGIICIRPGVTGDFTMEMYNADGSRGKMCGNGIRCVGKYVYDKGLTRKTCLTIDTDAGPRQLELKVAGGQVEQVAVDMGVPKLFPELSVAVKETTYTVNPVSMGNPHAVIFCPDPGRVPLEQVGPALECHPAFPEHTNVEFVSVQARDRLSLRVWERGSGITLACGTGACAAFAAAVKAGQCRREGTVDLPGGCLALRWDRDTGHITMTGPARTVFEGETDFDHRIRMEGGRGTEEILH